MLSYSASGEGLKKSRFVEQEGGLIDICEVEADKSVEERWGNVMIDAVLENIALRILRTSSGRGTGETG